MPRERMKRPAIVIPTDWIINAWVRAVEAGTSRSLVKTGNATAPPPAGVEPAMKEPNSIVIEAGQNSANRYHFPASDM